MIKKAFIKSFLGGVKNNWRAAVQVHEKLLVIESDDWGAIRTPSAESLLAFEKRGINLTKSIYKVDALASQKDLEYLFDLLLSIKNHEGQSPVITANAIMANPDFERIKAAGYGQYYFEVFTDTFKKYPEHHHNLSIWKKGMAEGIFRPQLHGREHLSIVRWLKALQSETAYTRYTFDWGSTYSGTDDYAFMEAYDWNEHSEVEQHRQIIQEAMQIFEHTFGFRAKSFIAPCYNWDPAIEDTLAQLGIEWIQGIASQLVPTGLFNRYIPLKHVFAERNQFGSRYNIRNVFFEPVNNPNIDWSDSAMARIQTAFLLNRPAVISTHRVNYVGYIDPRNRDSGLLQLRKLLNKVISRWPDVKFISTDQLSKYIVT